MTNADRDDLVTLDAETLAKLAIDQIVQDAKRAMQPHLDRLAQLAAIKPPASLVIDAAALDGVPKRWTLDHRMMDARTRPDHYRAPTDDRARLIVELNALEFKYLNAVEGEYTANVLRRARHMIEGTTE